MRTIKNQLAIKSQAGFGLSVLIIALVVVSIAFAGYTVYQSQNTDTTDQVTTSSPEEAIENEQDLKGVQDTVEATDLEELDTAELDAAEQDLL